MADEVVELDVVLVEPVATLAETASTELSAVPAMAADGMAATARAASETMRRERRRRADMVTFLALGAFSSSVRCFGNMSSTTECKM